MQMTSLGLPDLRSGVATSLKESSDFLSRWLVGGGGPFVETEEKKMFKRKGDKVVGSILGRGVCAVLKSHPAWFFWSLSGCLLSVAAFPLQFFGRLRYSDVSIQRCEKSRPAIFTKTMFALLYLDFFLTSRQVVILFLFDYLLKNILFPPFVQTYQSVKTCSQMCFLI